MKCVICEDAYSKEKANNSNLFWNIDKWVCPTCSYKISRSTIIDQPDRSKREDLERGCGTQNTGDKSVREVQ